MRLSRISRWLLPAVMAAFVASAAAQGPTGGWRPLFNGKNLEGWTQRNGSAKFQVEDGALVGLAVRNSPNSFLATKEEFGDFILEYEARVDGTMNSGVQVRSHQDPAMKNGRVHGYQVEIDPSPRAWSAGIYDESRRGWLHTLEFQEVGRRAFRLGEWNRFRVEAIGNSIRTWLNGAPCANIIDDQSPRGFIALQVHSVDSNTTQEGETVRFRNIRILTSDLARRRSPDRGDTPQYNHVPNTLSPREKAEGWRLLWDGASAAGWRGAKLSGFPQKGWEIRDGMLTVLDSGGNESAAGGDIVTVEKFSSFEFMVEFLITPGANSGIKYFVDTGINQGAGSAIGPEFQILDDERHPDAKLGMKGNRKLAGLYDLIPPVRIRFNGIGEWNRASIVARGRHVEHWMNGFQTVEYDRATQMWRALVDHSKYVVWKAFGELDSGHILLQDHGNRVSFRSMKIRELKEGAGAREGSR